MATKVVMTEDEISRAVKRMAHQIVETNKDSEKLVFIGIIARGATIAKRLAKLVQQIEDGEKIPVGKLDVSLYRDDIKIKGKFITVRKSDIPFSIEGKTVVLVDDVLYHGRTISAALDGLKDYGRAASIQLAVLVDRGHRELPVQPDYVGKKIPSTKNEQVTVNLTDDDGIEQVVIA